MNRLLTRFALWLLRVANPAKDEALADRLWILSCEYRREPKRWMCFEAVGYSGVPDPEHPWLAVQLSGPIPDGFAPAKLELRKKGDDTRGVVP